MIAKCLECVPIRAQWINLSYYVGVTLLHSTIEVQSVIQNITIRREFGHGWFLQSKMVSRTFHYPGRHLFQERLVARVRKIFTNQCILFECCPGEFISHTP